MIPYRRYPVSRRAKAPLVEFITESLKICGCRILHISDPGCAPFQISFETRSGERMGILAYAFLANSKVTRNRPPDEHRFQVKYGSKDGQTHQLFQDPHGLYTTLFLGINPERGFFVAADPVLHSPTRMFISLEFKEEHAREILANGWHCWERQKTSRGFDSPVETFVGARPERFLDYIRFEQATLAMDQGHRHLLAERFASPGADLGLPASSVVALRPPSASDLHSLSREFELSPDEILSLIEGAPRLKMAVRGWVAETHLETELSRVSDIVDLKRLEIDGQPDFEIRLAGGRQMRIECKNVLRRRLADGTVRVDFQRTRASKTDPCSRYYRRDEFQILAACLHPATEKWEFRYEFTESMAEHRRCPQRLDNRVNVDSRWAENFEELLNRETTPPSARAGG